jgi:hypothetical protein
VSLLYLNPPYDFEIGQQGNKRLESVFLEHTYRWLKQKGVLVFVIPQAQLKVCAKQLAEHFVDARIYRLTEPQSAQYGQIVVMALRRPRAMHLPDAELLQAAEYLRRTADQAEIDPLTNSADANYVVPPSGSATFVDQGIPLDKVEDLLPQSSAYREAAHASTRRTRQPARHSRHVEWRVRRGSRPPHRPLAFGEIRRSLGGKRTERRRCQARPRTVLT